MDALDLVKLTGLMEATRGRPEIAVGLIDGPVAVDHPDLAAKNMRAIPGGGSAACARADSAACLHGTFVGGILSAKRGSPAPAINIAATKPFQEAVHSFFSNQQQLEGGSGNGSNIGIGGTYLRRLLPKAGETQGI